MTIRVVQLESIQTRYTCEWADTFPRLIEQAAKDHGHPVAVEILEGSNAPQDVTGGSFLNFASTNAYKADQMAKMAALFASNAVQPGDIFVFADAWHPGVIALRYMSDLLGIPVTIVGLWHAGSYDQHDFLGRIADTTWAGHFERSLFYAIDVNCYATQFHIDLFKAKLGVGDDTRILRTGWPMEYLEATLAPYRAVPKRNLVLFPHRIAPEKQVSTFRDLAAEFPDYEFRVCQDTTLTKHEYHRLLGEANLVFSASLQETLGIGLYEGLLCGAVPFAPDRLSYREMYPTECLYPSEWTENWDSYLRHKRALVEAMRSVLAEPPKISPQTIGARFFSAERLMSFLVGS